MKSVPSGLWVSESSTITGYIAGAEWLEFLEGGKDHLWKIRQPVGELWLCRFRLEERDKDWLFMTTENGKITGKSWPISIDLLPEDRLSVSHHGFRTIFKRPASRRTIG